MLMPVMLSLPYSICVFGVWCLVCVVLLFLSVVLSILGPFCPVFLAVFCIKG